jgi:actin-like ATPase involved in cell morphogenesis
MEATMTGPAIGMDLGTTYSAVAWINADGEPEVIPDGEGNTRTPSVVSFSGGTPVVGAEAKRDQIAGAGDVMAFFKSSMGNPDFSCHIAGRDWTATDLSALVLAQLKAQAERALSTPVSQAVVTVPEYFTYPQREATLQAGRLAGLQVCSIISEPIAAALAYGLRPGTGISRFVVYDLGGGTFDVSVIALSADAVEVIAVAGDHELGGRDWDDRLAGSLQQRLRRDIGRELSAGNAGALLAEVERLKRALSARKSVEAQFGSAGKTKNTVITRAEFEEMTSDLLARTAALTERALHDAGLRWTEIDGVLPVGGSTRMPMVTARIEQMSGRPPVSGIHPDQAVVLGAAVQAGLQAGLFQAEATPSLAVLPPRKVPDIDVAEVTPSRPPEPPGAPFARGGPPPVGMEIYLHRVVLRWPQPERGVIKILRAGPHVALRPGDDLAEDQLANQGYLLDRPAPCADTLFGSEGSFLQYFPVLFIDGRCHVGHPRRYLVGPEVSGLSAEYLDSSVRLRWNWPQTGDEALVAWDGAVELDDPLTAIHADRVARSGDEITGRYDIPVHPAKQVFVLVAMTARANGLEFVSSGAPASARRPNIMLRYEVRSVRGAGGRRGELVLRPASSEWLPALVLHGRADGRAASRYDPVLLQVPPGQPGRELVRKFPLGSAVPQSCRLFVAGEGDDYGVHIIHPG